MNAPLRRGACPGLSAPMPTGDGLLVRLLPVGTMPLVAFAALCGAAREHGNGVVEVTARGSIQVRGLRPVSAPRFADAVAALRIAAADGLAVHVSPLAGLSPDEMLDTEAIAADVRRAAAGQALAMRLAPKISVAIDGGGAPGLDGLSADVRLRAELSNARPMVAVSVGGDDAGAERLGLVAPGDAAQAAIRVLEVMARRGRDVRARDVQAASGIGEFGAALGDLLRDAEPRLDCRARAIERTSVVGAHPTRDGSLACGIALGFGHADATSLERLTEAAAASGATGLRAAPGRALMFIGFSPAPLGRFRSAAERLGFIVRTDDPRRLVVACAGAPICASAHIAARALAPRIAAECAGSLRDGFIIHVSGCTKGCAHPAPAALTVVGTPDGCGLVSNGTARDAPRETMTVRELSTAIARHTRAANGEAHHA